MMSQEVSNQNLQSVSSRDVLKVTLLGGGWNSSAGGLATFNRELAIQLSQHPKVEVSFLVPDGHCTEEDKREARRYGITIVCAKKRLGYDPLDWLIAPPEGHKMDVVVGHSAKLGKQVQFIKESVRFHNCKWVQVVHTAPEDLSKFKGYANPTSKGEKKHEVEVNLCKRADLVVPVGPRLEEAYSSYLQRCKGDQDFFPVLPGLFDREFGDLEQFPNENAEFKVLLCGRGDEEDFELKGYDVAIKAFTDHRLQRTRYHLIFVGAAEEKQDEVRQRLLQGGIAVDQLTVRKFVQSREKMKDLLCEVDLVIMPSKSEGYGLVALEALSAGLPILVSSRSGFARALKNTPVGDSCIVDSDDPAKWAEKIEDVGVRHSVRLEEMKYLRESYGRRYSWKKQCENLVEKLWTMVNGTENRDSSVIGRQLEDVKGGSLKRTASEAFESTSTDRTQLQVAIQSMKANIKTETEQPTDLQQPFRPNPGEGPKPKDLKIDQIYVNVVIQEGRANYDFLTDRWEQLKVYPQPNKNQSMCVRPQDVIDDEYQNVLVVGRPGIGKTMMSTKLLRTWASDDAEMEKQFEVAFLLKFRHLNNKNKLSLHQLLACSETVESLDDEVWKFVVENPTKVLFIFDGIDEFLGRSDISKDDSKYKNSVNKKMPLHVLYKKLASGKLLRGATVITTTRPTAGKCVNNLNFDRIVEILGFTSEQVEEYVKKFTKDDQNDDAKQTIWQHISTNINLFSLCYIPVNCFIICHCLLQIINICTGTARKLPSKTTDIYSIHVKIFFFKHNRNDKYSRSKTGLSTYIYKKFDDLQPENDLVFKKLGEMAFNGIKQGRLVFESSEVGDLQDCGLLHRLPDVKSRELNEPPKPQFCFTHLTVQEFFAAKHLTDTMNKEDLRCFVASHIHYGAWQVVMQFVAGLLEPDADQGMSNIDIFADLLPTSAKEEDTLIMWPANDEDKRLALNVCKCLNEVDFEQKNSLHHKTKEIGFNALDFSECSLGPVDCVAITDFVKNSNIEAECLNLHFNDLGSLGCREICDLVKDLNCIFTTLNISFNNIGEQGAAYLCDALKDVNCKLTTLNLSNNNIGEQGAAQLCDALKDVNCNLTSLHLSNNNIGEQGAAYLCDALKDVNCNLTSLNLSNNNIGDQGAAYLRDALKDVNCNLTTLDLSGNDIGDQAAAYLRDALKDENCNLTTLDLSYNNIGEQLHGAAYLCDALKDVNCKLTTLDLRFNNIREQGAAYLCDALKDVNCNLTTLDLRGNHLIRKQGAAQRRFSFSDVNCTVRW